MRLLGFAVLFTLGVSGMAQAIDLDKPGVMESIARDNPERYLKITQIRELASQTPCFTGQFARAMQAKFDARNASCNAMLMTSLPSQRRLSFKLGDETYATVIRMAESASFQLIEDPPARGK